MAYEKEMERIRNSVKSNTPREIYDVIDDVIYLLSQGYVIELKKALESLVSEYGGKYFKGGA